MKSILNMNTIHQPARLKGETRDEYTARRAAHHRHVKRITCAGLSGGATSRQLLRDSMRQNGKMSKRRRFADVLMASWAKKRRPEHAAKLFEHRHA